MPVRCAFEILDGAGKWPRDHPAYAHCVQSWCQIGAQFQKPVQPESFLMRGNLENRVGRGVADWPARAHVGSDMGGNDGNARGVAIAQNRAGACQCANLGDQIRRKSRGIVGKIGPVPRHRNASKFPMAGWGIFAVRHFGCSTPTPVGHGIQARRLVTGCQPDRGAKAQGIKMRQL